MSFAEAFQAWSVVCIVFVAVCISEGVSYALVYRRDDYKRVCLRVKDLTKKCASDRGLAGGDAPVRWRSSRLAVLYVVVTLTLLAFAPPLCVSVPCAFLPLSSGATPAATFLAQLKRKRISWYRWRNEKRMNVALRVWKRR